MRTGSQVAHMARSVVGAGWQLCAEVLTAGHHPSRRDTTHILKGLPEEQLIPVQVQKDAPLVIGHSACGTPRAPAAAMRTLQSAALAVGPQPTCGTPPNEMGQASVSFVGAQSRNKASVSR